MGVSDLKKNNYIPYAAGAALFIFACVLQQADGGVKNVGVSKFIALAAQYVFLGLLAYWTVSVISRVSVKNIRIGLSATIILMSAVLILKLIKYNAVYNVTAERYLWYSYYVPQCLAPSVLLLTVLNMARKTEKPLSKLWNLLFVPPILLILLVFTNDLHQQVFLFPQGFQNAGSVYKWQWGYYLILAWIAGLYLINGVLLFIKCRVSHCRKKAWLPLTLFAACLACCILREAFNPAFIKMPETVVFSVVIVCESLILIGFIPSNKNYAEFFDVADVSAIITDKNLNVELSSKNAIDMTRGQAAYAFTYGEFAISKDLTLKAKAITGGEVFWTEDTCAINKINADLKEVNLTLSEEVDLISAENRLKEQRLKIEEQNNLYKNIFDVARPYFKKINDCFSTAVTEAEKDAALRKAVVYGVFLKRRSNLMLLKKDGKISVSELAFSLREVADALNVGNVYSSVFYSGDGEFPAGQIYLIFDFFEAVVESALPKLTACLVRLSVDSGALSCRIALDNVKTAISGNGFKKECEKQGAVLNLERSDGTLYVTLNFLNKGVSV